ncbi:MAG: Beta-Casp domain containing protein [Firmicutes bacterium]|nr:Beta-Casp domain containing protein [Bacillota bacterium]
MQLTFLGAAMMVTGSSYLLETDGYKLLVDCGMFQGPKATEALNRRPFAYDPATLDCVLLTHAHIDHSGLLPKLCKAGFKGKIYATDATAALCRIMLADSAHIQEFEAEIANRKGRRSGGKVVEPVYTVEDAENCIKQFKAVAYGAEIRIAQDIVVKFDDAGHILGSSMIEILVTEKDKKTKLVFSGDLGQPDQPIIKDPSYIEEADYIVLESTYGNRLHEHFDAPLKLAEIINDTVKRGGNVVIPAFAVGRTQTIVYYLHQLLKAGKIPDLPVFIDSPLAISATDIFMAHPNDYDSDALAMLYTDKDNPLKLPHLVFTKTSEESKAINFLSEPAIIISASGMADAGRILHHLKHNLWRPESSVLLVGYQAEGSMGRRLIEGVKRVKIMGEEVTVKAKIYNLDGFSAHADKEQLINWLTHVYKAPAKIFLVHGEPDKAESLSSLIKERLGFSTYIPQFGDSAVIDGREYKLEGNQAKAIDRSSVVLQKYLDQLDGDYLELRKRVEQILVQGNGKVPGVLSVVEDALKFVKKTLDTIDKG